MTDTVTIERTALRRIALRRHVRMGYGGTEIPNGGGCVLCGDEWEANEPESHELTCPLAETR